MARQHKHRVGCRTEINSSRMFPDLKSLASLKIPMRSQTHLINTRMHARMHTNTRAYKTHARASMNTHKYAHTRCTYANTVSNSPLYFIWFMLYALPQASGVLVRESCLIKPTLKRQYIMFMTPPH